MVNDMRLLGAGRPHGSSQPSEAGTIISCFKDENWAFSERKGQLLPSGRIRTPEYRAKPWGGIGGQGQMPTCTAHVANAMTLVHALVCQHVGTQWGAWGAGTQAGACAHVCVGMWQGEGVHFWEHSRDAREPSHMCTLQGTHPCAGLGGLAPLGAILSPLRASVSPSIQWLVGGRGWDQVTTEGPLLLSERRGKLRPRDRRDSSKGTEPGPSTLCGLPCLSLRVFSAVTRESPDAPGSRR